MATPAPGANPPVSNPYAAPEAAVEDIAASGPELATRGERFAAALVDGLIFGAVGMLGGFLGGPGFGGTPYNALVIALMVAVGLVNLWLIHRSRASIGKLALKIRMVRSDGSEAELWRLVLLRGLPQWIVSSIPIVNLLSLVDVLFIFGKARRCVHDYIADTIVVKTR